MVKLTKEQLEEFMTPKPAAKPTFTARFCPAHIELYKDGKIVGKRFITDAAIADLKAQGVVFLNER